MDDFESYMRNRNRILGLQADSAAARDAAQGRMRPEAGLIGKVFNGGSKSALAGRYVLVHPGRATSIPEEGPATGYQWDVAKSIPVAVLGTLVPAVGDILECFAVANRWVAEQTGPSTFAWTFNVRGCKSTGIAGAVIELYQSGVLIASCTTGDGTSGTVLGRCVMTVPAGTYDIVITGPSGGGFAVNTSTASIAATKTTNVVLAAASGTACWACCDFPVPSALHSTDSDGPITLPLGIDGSGNPFYLLATTTAVSDSCDNGPIGVGCVNCVTPSVTTKLYRIVLLTNCTAVMSVAWETTTCSGVDHYKTTRDGTATNIMTPVPVTSGNCSPMNLVFTLPTTIPGTTLGVPGGGGVMAFTA